MLLFAQPVGFRARRPGLILFSAALEGGGIDGENFGRVVGQRLIHVGDLLAIGHQSLVSGRKIRSYPGVRHPSPASLGHWSSLVGPAPLASPPLVEDDKVLSSEI